MMSLGALQVPTTFRWGVEVEMEVKVEMEMEVETEFFFHKQGLHSLVNWTELDQKRGMLWFYRKRSASHFHDVNSTVLSSSQYGPL